ncbi:MAG: LacI family DNA-binding transcriptional regulator [Calditrichaeota bacterium]|nr:LacI family DNA-binding transcriptional regulator [Calditrichota bacterium]
MALNQNKPAQSTLDDIARKLNVTKVTVSKALRDHPDISLETKEKVKTVARELGYTPNFIARSLSLRRSGTIGVVVPKIAHHFFSTAVETIYDSALQNSYEVILMLSQENAQREALHIQTLLSMRVDGLLISLSKETKDLSLLEAVKKSGLPTVLFDRVVEKPEFSTVTTDDEEGAFSIIEHAIHCGYRKIAHLAGYSHTSIGRLRRSGFEKAMMKHDIPMHPEWIIEGGFAEEDGYHAFMNIYHSKNLPEIIFAVTYPVALGIFSAAREKKIAIPEDLDVICIGGSNYNKYICPTITCIDQPVQEIGKQAISILLDNVMNPGQNRIQKIKIPGRLFLGDTCRKKSA